MSLVTVGNSDSSTWSQAFLLKRVLEFLQNKNFIICRSAHTCQMLLRWKIEEAGIKAVEGPRTKALPGQEQEQEQKQEQDQDQDQEQDQDQDQDQDQEQEEKLKQKP